MEKRGTDVPSSSATSLKKTLCLAVPRQSARLRRIRIRHLQSARSLCRSESRHDVGVTLVMLYKHVRLNFKNGGQVVGALLNEYWFLSNQFCKFHFFIFFYFFFKTVVILDILFFNGASHIDILKLYARHPDLILKKNKKK